MMRPAVASPVHSLAIAMTWVTVALPLRSQSLPLTAERERADVYSVDVRSSTHLELYRRALLPGASGTLVLTDTHAPLHQYVALHVAGLDLPFQRDGLDVELSAWGRLDLADVEGSHRLDGDLRTANVRYRADMFSLTLGRQVTAGGAARYSRHDGVRVDADLGSSLGASAYAGFVALAPTSRRRGYVLLGATPEALVRAPEVYEDEDRVGWLVGARLEYRPSARYGGALSVHHEESNRRLERQSAAAELYAEVTESATCAGTALLDIDSAGLADGRVFCDLAATRSLDFTLELLHTEPALFLPRHSVLSVFSTENYREFGGWVSYAPVRAVTLGARAHVDHYGDGDFGSRSELSARFKPDGTDRLLIMLAYTRLVAAQNGYHGLRASFRRRLVRSLMGTLEGYLYLYDDAVLGYRSSAVYASTLSYPLGRRFGLMLGGSIARSPYARLDAQSTVRLSYELARTTEGAP